MKKKVTGKGTPKKKAKAKGTPLDPDASYARHKFVSLAYKQGKRQSEIKGAHPNEAKEAGRLARKEAAIEWDGQHR